MIAREKTPEVILLKSNISKTCNKMYLHCKLVFHYYNSQ